jgi:carbamoyl-phosphate synthase large subunit
MTNLLFTGGGGAGNAAIYHTLENSYEMHFADADELAMDPALPGDRCHAIPRADSGDFVPGVSELCTALDIDVVIPGVDEELPLIPEVVACTEGLDALLPEAGYVTRMLDKLTMAEALKAAGLPIPDTVTVAEGRTGDFPCIVKPRHGRGSRGVQILQREEQLEAYVSLSGQDPEQIILQALQHGQEYTVLMAADRQGLLRAVVPVKVDVKRGITLRAETVHNVDVINGCQAIHEALPTVGCYNIQLILTGDGQMMPFEINPRVSTTFCLGLSAGIDPITIYRDEVAGDGLLSFRTGVRLRRHWTNYIDTGQ